MKKEKENKEKELMMKNKETKNLNNLYNNLKSNLEKKNEKNNVQTLYFV